MTISTHPSRDEPRFSSRLRQAWGKIVGPEAAALDHALTAGITAVGTTVAVALARRRGGNRQVVAVTAVLAADLIGGAYVNNSLASARWYERPGQGDRQHLVFAACHIHPVVVACLDSRQCGVPAVGWATAHYSYLMAATLIIRKLSRFRRPLGPVLTAGGLMLDRMLGPSQRLPWFASAYYSKLLMGHAAASLWAEKDIFDTGTENEHVSTPA